MDARLVNALDGLRTSYWFIPSLMAAGAVGAAVLCLEADRAASYNALQKSGIIFSGGPEGARAVLSAIAGSVITVAGTTFSITIASLSLTSAQFGPRLLRSFMRDRGNQVVLGTFTATFLFCLLVLRTVRGADGYTMVPHISVTFGVVLAIFSLAVLIYFIHHVTQSIQVSHVVQVAGAELDAAIRRVFPQRIGQPAPSRPDAPRGGHPIAADHSGYVQAIESQALLDIAAELNATLTLIARPGDYAIAGTPLALCEPAADERTAARIRRAFALGRTRTPSQDAVFAFLQLTDIALRALSPSLNDPLTATMCLDRITSAMCLLNTRGLPDAVRSADSGRGRVIAYPYSYNDLVTAAFHHIADAAAEQPIVQERLRWCIQTVLESAPGPEMIAALLRELDHCRAFTETRLPR